MKKSVDLRVSVTQREMMLQLRQWSDAVM